MKTVERETRVNLAEEEVFGAPGRKSRMEPADYALLVILFLALGLMLLHG